MCRTATRPIFQDICSISLKVSLILRILYQGYRMYFVIFFNTRPADHALISLFYIDYKYHQFLIKIYALMTY